MQIKLLKKGIGDWFSGISVITTLITIILYNIMEVGEFNIFVVVFSIIGMLLSAVYIITDMAYSDLLAFLSYCISLGFFIESKVFYISAVFVGIDYKSFDLIFCFAFASMAVTLILSAVASIVYKNNGKIND